MVKSRRFCLGTTTLLGLGSASFALIAPNAEAAPEQPRPQPAAVADLCHDDPRRQSSTLTFLACSLRDELPPLTPTTVVVSRPLRAGSAEGAHAFATRLTLLLSSATRTRDGGVAVGTNPSDAEAVLLLEPQLHGTLVQVNATLIGKRASVWARLRGATHQVLAHAFVSRPLDLELQSYLPKVPLVRPTVATYPSPIAPINAIACGDIDADGALDIAVANRRDVALGSLGVKGLEPTRVATLGDLSEVATVPLREPLAALWVSGTTLEASTTDRRHWLKLGADLEPLAKRPNQWGIAPGLCVARDAGGSPLAFDCETPPKLSDATSISFNRVVAFGSTAEQRVIAWRDPVSAQLTVQTASRTWTLPEAGAQLAIADLNHDGTLEVLSTSPSRARSDDRITVHTLPHSAKEPVLVWELPVATGVDALAVCPPDGGNQSAIVFASNDHVGVAL